MNAVPRPITAALHDAATARHGTTLAAWEEALRALVQQQMELAVYPLSQAMPGMLDDVGPKFSVVEVTLPLPAGERVRFYATLELVE